MHTSRPAYLLIAAIAVTSSYADNVALALSDNQGGAPAPAAVMRANGARQPALAEAPVAALPVRPKPSMAEQKESDQSHLYSALYELASEGWVGTPLTIDSVSDATNLSASLSPNPSASADKVQLIREFGGIECAKRTFSRGQRRIYVTVYRFANSDGACGAYLELRQGASNFIQRGDASSEDENSISFWKDRYFASILGTSEDDDESKAVVTQFANKLAKTLTVSSAEPALMNQLPVLERVHGSEKIVMGPLSLKRAFPAPFANIFASARIVDGAVADYRMQVPYPERLKLMLAKYESPEAAARVYLSYIGQLQDQHHPQASDSFLPESSLFKVGGTFLFCQRRDSEIIVITGARKKPSVGIFARQVF